MGLADVDFVEQCSWEGVLRYAVQRSGFDDFEVADRVGISHGYMSKVLKGTAGLYGRRLVRFMRETNCAAPVQWLGNQIGADMTLRNVAAARIAALKAEVARLEGRAA